MEAEWADEMIGTLMPVRKSMFIKTTKFAIYCKTNWFRKLVCVLVWCLLWTIPKRGNAAEFGVNGVIVCNLLRSDGQVFTNYSYDFTARTETNGWNIKVVFGKDHYLCAGSDGTNVYTVLEDPKGRKSTKSSMPGKIVNGSYPLNDDWYITVPWLALCSSSYLNEHGTANLPAPWVNARIDPTASAFVAEVRRTGGEALPASIIFTCKKKSADDLKSLGWLNSQHLQGNAFQILETFQEGFVGAEYAVKNSTNFDGIILPTEFELKCFLPDKSHSLYKVFHGTILQFFRPSRSTFLPEILGPVSVADFRLRDASAGIDFVNYSLTNSDWITPNSSDVQAFFRKKQGMASQMGLILPAVLTHTKQVRAIIVMSLAVLTLFPFVWWYWKRKHKKNTQQR